MAIKLNVNTDAVVIFTNKLEKLTKTAFPNAVRGTLNSLAFDVKQNTMPRESDRAFINRQKNFFKANSRVETARGKDVDSMQSAVGFKATSKTKNNKAVDELEQQEHGGTIKDRSLIPLPGSRVSKNTRRKVAPRNRLGRINPKTIVRTSDVQGASEAARFIKTILHVGKGGIFQSTWKGRDIIWRVNSLNRTKAGQFKLTALYSFKSGRVANIGKATHFMEKATMKTAKKVNEIYIKEAKRQFDKHFR